MPIRNSDVARYFGNAAVGIFSETDAVVEKIRKKKESGGFPNSDDIRDVREIFRAEALDAGSLVALSMTKRVREALEDPFSRAYVNAAFPSVLDACEAHRDQVASLLRNTSVRSAFFGSVLEYLEDYEARYGTARKPGLDAGTVSRLLGMGYERVKAAFERYSDMATEELVPVQVDIVRLATERPEDERIGGLILRRAVISQKYREGSESLKKARDEDFENVAKRLARHGYRVSFIWK